VCDLICDVIVCCVQSCDTGKINACDKILHENQKIWKKRNCDINLHLQDRLHTEFTACEGELMPEEALASLTLSDAFRQFAG